MTRECYVIKCGKKYIRFGSYSHMYLTNFPENATIYIDKKPALWRLKDAIENREKHLRWYKESVENCKKQCYDPPAMPDECKTKPSLYKIVLRTVKETRQRIKGE